MGQELKIPDSFKNFKMPAAFAAVLNAEQDNLAQGIGQSYGVVGYKGKTWSLRYRGERKNIIRPDDGTPSGHIDVIVLAQAGQKSKSFYKQYDQGTSDGDRPICSSIDGITPDADAQQKQSAACAICPRNVWKQDPNGRRGRECTDYKRLAVLLMPYHTKPIMGGSPLIEPVFLRVPPDSLNSLAIMGETMGNQGFHYSTYITRITFDPQKAHPCMVFTPLQGLTDKEAPTILTLRDDPTTARITGGDQQSTLTGTAGSHAGTINGTSSQTTPTDRRPEGQQDLSGVSTQTPTHSAQNGSQSTTGLDTGFGTDAQPATPARTGSSVGSQSDTQNSLASNLGDIGSFGGASNAATVTPSPVTVEDVGESDDDLDRKIAELMSQRKH